MDRLGDGFDWTQMRTFLVTVDKGSLSAAARVLGVTQPTVGRQISGLERDLGVLLFERSGRVMTLTQSGRDLVEHVRTMDDAAQKISLVASGRSQAIDGLVRITASDIFCAYLLPQALYRLREVAPSVDIDLVASNRVRDLIRREADIAIRHVRPKQPELIARKVRESVVQFYAAPEYLMLRGTPQSVEDLATHDFVGFGDAQELVGHLNASGLSLSVEQLRYGSSSGIVAWELVKQGFGIGVMAEEIGVMTEEVVPVLHDVIPIRFPSWLVTHQELHTSKRIRLVYDLLADFLQEQAPF